MDDLISRQAAIDALAKAMPSLTTPDGCGEFDHEIQIAQEAFVDAMQIIHELPSARPERTCVNCGRTANNGGWYADGRTRCPIEEHYALPKDGYCHLWEKRNVKDWIYTIALTASLKLGPIWSPSTVKNTGQDKNGYDADFPGIAKAMAEQWG